MLRLLFLLSGICSVLLILSCGPSKKTTVYRTIDLDTVTVTASHSSAIYRASSKKINDLVHTKLDIKFSWEKQELYGKATITLHPHFYPTDSLVLDAKGMFINKVEIINKDHSQAPLAYTYDSLKLHISLGRAFSATDTFSVFIDYTSRPTELHFLDGKAMDEARGLYFINHDGKEKNKPRQIWSQGETESASCWFPTIDATNQRMTQEICLTADTGFVTLSNGLLEYSLVNPDGTRTDCWKQSLPSAPYLSMIAVGDYAVIKDKWRDLEVNYYVEKKYAPYGKQIFGNTPEMIGFFSKKLGVDYPWEKFSQVAVRNFISGAMENTTVVVHGDYIQRDARQLLDETNEEVISHELFHHWFGDMVTCESWSNLPLNESFATYGEYLWNEYKYGREEADMAFQNDLAIYLKNADKKELDLIRFHYDDKEEMFDAVSYQKGGRVLHMLRKYVGDEAFFASLKLYLETNKFSSVEVHDLRLAFEKVTGEDLNWFFNEWFLKNGHPQLEFSYSYNDSAKKEMISVKQTQDISSSPVFKLPVVVDLYYEDGKKERRAITISKISEEFAIDAKTKPSLVNVDADKILLCSKKDFHSRKEWIYQYYHAPLYLDRYEAILHAAREAEKDSSFASVIVDALNDQSWYLRTLAEANITKSMSSKYGIKDKLISLAKSDPKSKARGGAINALKRFYDDTDLIPLYKQCTNDSSYYVIGAALRALEKKDSSSALAMAKKFESDNDDELVTVISSIYSKSGSDPENNFFVKAIETSEEGEKYQLISDYGHFLIHCSDEIVNSGLKIIEETALTGNPWWVKLSAVHALVEMQIGFEEKAKKNSNTILEKEMASAKAQAEKIKPMIESIKKEEKDPNLRKIYDSGDDGKKNRKIKQEF